MNGSGSKMQRILKNKVQKVNPIKSSVKENGNFHEDDDEKRDDQLRRTTSAPGMWLFVDGGEKLTDSIRC